MHSARSDFSAPAHGFRFPNHFDLLPEIRLPTGGKFDLGTVIIGLCGGMCFAALDYYQAGHPLPTYLTPEEIEPKILKYLRRRQKDSVPLRALRRIWDWAWTDDHKLEELVTRLEFPKLQLSLDRGDPAVLLVMRTRGFENLTLNHQVLATGYEMDAINQQAIIFLYDPNHPGQEPSVCINLATPYQEFQLTQSTGEPLRGFFLMNYRPKTPPVSR